MFHTTLHVNVSFLVGLLVVHWLMEGWTFSYNMCIQIWLISLYTNLMCIQCPCSMLTFFSQVQCIIANWKNCTRSLLEINLIKWNVLAWYSTVWDSLTYHKVQVVIPPDMLEDSCHCYLLYLNIVVFFSFLLQRCSFVCNFFLNPTSSMYNFRLVTFNPDLWFVKLNFVKDSCKCSHLSFVSVLMLCDNYLICTESSSWFFLLYKCEACGVLICLWHMQVMYLSCLWLQGPYVQ